MTKKVASLVLAVLFTLTLFGLVSAEQVEGKIKSVSLRGRRIVVEVDGREVKLKVSANGTWLEGVKKRSELKKGQMVTVEYEGDRAQTIIVNKSIQKGKL